MQLAVNSDQELVRLYIGGSQEALEALIKKHKRKIYTSIFLLVKEKHRLKCVPLVLTIKPHHRYRHQRKSRNKAVFPVAGTRF